MSESRTGAWAVIAALAAVGGSTQLLWLTYAPVTDVAAQHYGVSAMAIGWLANVFPLWYVLLAIPAGLLLDRWPRGIVAVGAVLAAVGAAVRLGGDTYPAAMAGQNLISIAQPLVLTAVTPLSVRYLAERDRPTGIALASAGTFAGMIAAFALGTLLDLRAVLIADTVLAVVAAVALVIALRERPAFIPSAPSGGMRDFLACWRDPLVRRTCLTVIIPFGTFTALTTWAQPLLGPAGIDADQAGILLMLNVTAGVIGCAVIPVWAARHGLRRRVLVTGILATVVGCIALSLVPSFIVGLVCFAVVGALLLSALPIVLEITERAMPRAAGAAAGLVWLAGQLGALVITGVIGELLGAPMVAFLVLGALTALALPVIPSRRAIGERPVPGVRASAAG